MLASGTMKIVKYSAMGGERMTMVLVLPESNHRIPKIKLVVVLMGGVGRLIDSLIVMMVFVMILINDTVPLLAFIWVEVWDFGMVLDGM